MDEGGWTMDEVIPSAIVLHPSSIKIAGEI